MSDQGYILFREIQQEILHSYYSEFKPLGFRDAFLNIWRKGLYHTGRPEIPDFSQWDINDISALKKFTDQIPISLKRVLSVIPSYHDTQKEMMLPPANPVQINLESSYCPELFTVLNDYVVIVYVLSGSCILHVRRNVHHMKAGDLAILAPGIPYYVSCTESDLILDILSLTKCFDQYFFGIIQKDQLMYTFFQRALYGSGKEYLLFFVPPANRLLHLIQNLFIEFLSDDPYSTDVFLNYTQIFYAEILRSPRQAYHYYKAGNDIDSYTLIPAIFRYIQRHYRTLTLDSLAAEFHYHPSYLSRLISQSTGKTLSRILTDLRITEAKHLLSSGDLSVGEISRLAGYHSTDHFSSVFRKATGMSPSKYRKTVGKTFP